MAEGINGVGVAVATAGGIFLYAAFKGMSPLEALKSVAAGNPSPVEARTIGYTKSGGSSGGGSSSGSGSIQASVTSGPFPELANAVMRFRTDRYSQLKRWEPGYSDCSSFVGKGLKDLGIKPPGNTFAYLSSPQWKRISSSSAGAGDVAVSTSHMVVCLGNGNAIGQQSTRRNVQTGTVTELMTGSPSYVYLRYVGTKPRKVAQA